MIGDIRPKNQVRGDLKKVMYIMNDGAIVQIAVKELGYKRP